MEIEKLKLLIAEGEGLTIEFKEKYSSKIDRDIVALSNSKGGYILLGVNDEGKITGDKLTNQMKAEILQLARNCDPQINLSKVSQIDNVIIVEVSEGEEKPYSCSSGYFRRLDAVTQKMTQKEVRSIFMESPVISFEGLSHKGINLEDISLKKVNVFLEESKTKAKATKRNVGSILASLDILDKGKINNAGVLMFASKVGRFISHAELICGAFKGMNKTYIYDRLDVRDDLLTQLNVAMAFIRKHINVRSEIREVNRYDIYEIPLDAIREAVVNAIIHRDYNVKGTSIYVSVYDDRIEIENPGGLPAGLSPKDFGKTSLRRNLIIADLFHRMSKVERIGSGIKRMRDLMKEASLKEPYFEMTSFFRTSFYRDPQYSLKGSQTGGQTGGQRKNIVLSDTQKEMLKIIMKKPQVSRNELAYMISINPSAVQKHLVKLKEAGYIKRIGADFGGHWEVKEDITLKGG